MSDTVPLRERILQAAIRLFAEQGYGSTSVRELVEAVGCTKPTLYYHFGSKEELWLAAVQHNLDAVRALTEESVSGPGDVRTRLHTLVQRNLAHVAEFPSGCQLLATAQHQSDSGQPAVDLMSVHQGNAVMIAGLLKEGVESGEIRADIDIEDLTFAIIGMFNLRMIASLFGFESPDDAADRILKIFFEGAAPRGVAP